MEAVVWCLAHWPWGQSCDPLVATRSHQRRRVVPQVPARRARPVGPAGSPLESRGHGRPGGWRPNAVAGAASPHRPGIALSHAGAVVARRGACRPWLRGTRLGHDDRGCCCACSPSPRDRTGPHRHTAAGFGDDRAGELGRADACAVLIRPQPRQMWPCCAEPRTPWRHCVKPSFFIALKWSLGEVDFTESRHPVGSPLRFSGLG